MPHLDISFPLTNPVLIFALVLFIILFAPIVLGKLRIPHIVGLIVAGMLIGPHGFNLMLRDSGIVLFGTVGLLYIMFLAGIEMEISDLKRNTGKSIVFGLFTFVIPGVSGIAIAYYVLDYGILSSLLVGSLFASHTLVAYPIVNRFGVVKTRAVNIAVGGTVIADTLALLMLAAVASIARGSLEENIIIRLVVSVAALGVFVMVVFPALTRWFFKEFDDGISQYIFVLGMLFLAAFLSEIAGLEPIIGAFFAGIALNRLIPLTSPLMNRIAFVGNALFIPFFLIGVGMLVDLTVYIGNTGALVVAAVMTLGGTLAKYLAALATQKSFRLSADERRMIFGLSTARVGATLAVVLIGYTIITGETATGEPIRLLNDDVLNGAILMILITCAISSFVTERAAGNLARMGENQPVPQPQKQVERILIPIANPLTIQSLMELAVLIKNPKSREPLFALNVVGEQESSPDARARGLKLLERAASAAAATDNRVEMITRYDVNVTSGIIHAIKENSITDVIIGLHEKSKFAEKFFGTKADHLLNSTHQMILITKSVQPFNTLKRTLVAVPPKAEFETGFVKWCERIHNLARQAGTGLLFLAGEETLQKLREQGPGRKETAYRQWNDWKGFSRLSQELRKNDLLVVVAARKTSISYNPLFEKLPRQLAKHFRDNSFIMLYPEQFGEDPDSMMQFLDRGLTTPIDRSLEGFTKVGSFVRAVIPTRSPRKE